MLSTRIAAPQTDYSGHSVKTALNHPSRNTKSTIPRFDPQTSDIAKRTTTSEQNVITCQNGGHDADINVVEQEIPINGSQSLEDEDLDTRVVEINMEEQGLDIKQINSASVDLGVARVATGQGTAATGTFEPTTSERPRKSSKKRIHDVQGESKSSASQSNSRGLEREKTIRMATVMIGNKAIHAQESRMILLDQIEGTRMKQGQPTSTRPRTPISSTSSFASSRSTSAGQQAPASAPPQKHTAGKALTRCVPESQTPTMKRSVTIARSSFSNRRQETTTDGNPIASTPATPRPNTLQARPRPQPSATRPNTSSKVLFTTYQRTFTPSKPRKASSSTPSNPPHLPTSSVQDLVHLRLQTHLLHLSLLSSAAPQTLTSYIFSAQVHLSASHLTLQSIHAELLPLVRRARQYRNLWAMDRWSGGNVVGLRRKVGSVIAVLEELLGLTEPGTVHEEFVDSGTEAGVGREEGAYSKVLRRFIQWVDWVEDIWASRDSAESPLYPNRNGNIRDGVNGRSIPEEAPPSHMKPYASNATRTHHHYHYLTPIDALGDSTTADIRALTHILHGLSLRLSEVRQTPFPKTQTKQASTTILQPKPQTEATTTTTMMSDPERIVKNTLKLIGNMQEELQLMREVEFEVVVGERAWREEGLRRVEREVGRGFA